MSFEWADYLAVAQELAGQPMPNPPSREAKLRSANSRAYYAAFWVALIHLRVMMATPISTTRTSPVSMPMCAINIVTQPPTGSGDRSVRI